MEGSQKVQVNSQAPPKNVGLTPEKLPMAGKRWALHPANGNGGKATAWSGCLGPFSPPAGIFGRRSRGCRAKSDVPPTPSGMNGPVSSLQRELFSGGLGVEGTRWPFPRMKLAHLSSLLELLRPTIHSGGMFKLQNPPSGEIQQTTILRAFWPTLARLYQKKKKKTS